jgi:hypothetical protein
VCSLIFLQAAAQQVVPSIRVGTELSYRFFLNGQTTALNLTVKSMADTVKLDWNLRGYAYGSYLISAAGFQHGKKINFIQPANKIVHRLADDETFAIISKAAFADLKKNKRFVYNNTTYVLNDDTKQHPFRLGDQDLDVIHVTGVEEDGDLWILDNPDFPLICQIRANPLGINFSLIAVK